jgi:hypothetical protein
MKLRPTPPEIAMARIALTPLLGTRSKAITTVDASCGTTLGFYGSRTVVRSASTAHFIITLRACDSSMLRMQPNNLSARYLAI